MNEKNYAVDKDRIFGLRESEQDPDAPDSVWVPVISTDREECSSPEARIDAMRYVTARGTGAASSIDRTTGPFVDNGQKAPVGIGLDPSNPGIIGAEQYTSQVAAQKFHEARNHRSQFVSFHRVRRDSLLN